METGGRSAEGPGGLRSVFRSLGYRNYRLYFTGQSLSLIGTWIQRIALPWLVYRLTDSALLLGVVGFAGQIPVFLLSPLTGVMVDRWNRYHVLIVTQVLAMAQAMALTVLFFTGIIQVWHIILIGTLFGSVNAFAMPARQAFIVEMVENREDLGNAIALNSSMFNGARLVGPSVAGLLIAATNEGVCFLVNGLSYLFVIASLLFMRVTPREARPRDTRVFQGLKEGFSYAFGFPPIRAIILLLGLVSIMGMPYTVLMPVFAKEVLHGGAHTFGFLMGAAGMGALTGALYLASRRSVLGLGRLIPLAASVFGLGLVAFSLSRTFWLSLVLVYVVGLGMITQLASSNTVIQTIVEDEKRGRVMSLYSMAFAGTAPFGSLLAGWLASTVGAPTTLMVGGASCLAGALLFARSLPRLREMVQPIYVRLGILPEVASGIQAATELSIPPER